MGFHPYESLSALSIRRAVGIRVSGGARFASLLSSGFIAMAVINPPEKKLGNQPSGVGAD